MIYNAFTLYKRLWGGKMSNIKINKSTKIIFGSKPYRILNRSLIALYVLFMLVYMLRDYLYQFNNQYITLMAETAPNLIPSFLFTLIGIYYVLPCFKDCDSINKTVYIWIINILNILVFIIIEYLHVIFKLGSWDNNDMVASLIGVIASTSVYFLTRKKLSSAF